MGITDKIFLLCSFVLSACRNTSDNVERRETPSDQQENAEVTDPYSSGWDECLDRANAERAEDARPELVEKVEKMTCQVNRYIYFVPMEPADWRRVWN